MSTVKAAIITIGDELLIGQTIDTNSAWIAQQLNAFGIDIIRRVAVGDESDAITGAIDEELGNVSILLITGGLGPTSDDITKPVLCKYFGGNLVVDEKVKEHLLQLAEKMKRPILERNMKQAEVPDNCTVIPNEKGSAPGMWFEQEGKVIVSMPGVPFEMIAMMESEVLPRLRKRFFSDAIVHRTIITAGEGESIVAERIKDLEETLPAHIKLAYLPDSRMVKLRLTGRSNDELRLIKEVEMRRDEIAGRLEDITISLEDLPLEHILGKEFVTRGLKLGLAESCTGGYIAHKITQIMGSAGYFMGSIVCYQESVKEDILKVKKSTIEKNAVVSEAVALEMAEGARKVLKADVGFGVTGLLSPGGEDSVPVGTVWMAITDGKRNATKRFHFQYDRLRNKEMATQMSLLLIWRFLHNRI